MQWNYALRSQLVKQTWTSDQSLLCSMMTFDQYESSLIDSFGHIWLIALIWGLYIGTGGNVAVQLTVEYGSAIFGENSCIIPVFL